ncbi:MAG: hypothetical protein IJT59_06765 [Desulfovibrionaceae bacterium]|nr:hypothetical protein [Desulfovibrionaceae bacterium]
MADKNLSEETESASMGQEDLTSKPAAKKTRRTTKRATKATESIDDAGSGINDLPLLSSTAENDSSLGPNVAADELTEKPKKTRSRKTTKTAKAADASVSDVAPMAEDASSSEPKARKSRKPLKNASSDEASSADDSSATKTKARSTAGRTTRKKVAKDAAKPGSLAQDGEPQASDDLQSTDESNESLADQKDAAKTTRSKRPTKTSRTTRSRAKKAKDEDSASLSAAQTGDDGSEDLEDLESKRRGRSKSSAKKSQVDDQTANEDLAALSTDTEDKDKALSEESSLTQDEESLNDTPSAASEALLEDQDRAEWADAPNAEGVFGQENALESWEKPYSFDDTQSGADFQESAISSSDSLLGGNVADTDNYEKFLSQESAQKDSQKQAQTQFDQEQSGEGEPLVSQTQQVLEARERATNLDGVAEPIDTDETFDSYGRDFESVQEDSSLDQTTAQEEQTSILQDETQSEAAFERGTSDSLAANRTESDNQEIGEAIDTGEHISSSESVDFNDFSESVQEDSSLDQKTVQDEQVSEQLDTNQTELSFDTDSSDSLAATQSEFDIQEKTESIEIESEEAIWVSDLSDKGLDNQIEPEESTSTEQIAPQVVLDEFFDHGIHDTFAAEQRDFIATDDIDSRNIAF